MRINKHHLLFSAAAFALAAGDTHAQQRAFNLDAQHAAVGIPLFARQAGIQIIGPADDLAGAQTAAIHGTLDIKVALRALLAGSGLEVKSSDNQIYVLTQRPRLIKISTMARDVAPPDAAAAASPAAVAGPEVEAVIVTAQRRSENLQEVPFSVTALTESALAAGGVTEVKELTQIVPGLVFSRRNQVFQPTIRGIGTSGASAGDESAVGIYVDGVYQPEMYSGSFDVLKVDRIEVLRGPQGTLFGRNTSGGLVNVITPDPGQEKTLEVTARYGRFDERSLQGYASTGLTDNLTADLAVKASADDGYVKDLVRGGHLGVRRAISARTKFVYRPSDEVYFALAVNASQVRDNSSTSVQPLNRNAVVLQTFPNTVLPTGPWQAALNIKPKMHSHQYGASLKSRFDFTDVALETTSSVQSNSLSLNNDLDGTPVQLNYSTSHNPSGWATQEIRLVSIGSDRLQWTAGAFGFYGRAELAPLNQYATSLTTGVTTPTLGSRRTIIKSAAGFAEGTYRITDALRVTGGLRYTSEERTFKATQNGLQVVDAKSSFKAWTPKASVQYVFNDNANVYFTYSRGFKSGVYNTQSILPTAVRPETVDSFEVGLKADPARWLRTNLALFKYNYKDLQVTARNPITLASFLQNAAQAEGKGAELEVTAAVTHDLNLHFNAAYLDAHYKSFPSASVTVPRVGGGNTTVFLDESGKHLQRAPRATASGGFDYNRTFDSGALQVAANYYVSAKYYWDPSERLFQRGYDKLSAMASWTFPNHVRVGVWGDNLTNSAVYTQILSSTNVDYAGYERPRSYGVEVSWKY